MQFSTSTQLENLLDFFPVGWKTREMERYLTETIDLFVKKRFVLLCGPRQVGKTSLARAWLQEHPGKYFNWDIDVDRGALLKSGFVKDPPSTHMVFDELHKHVRWKSWLKGLYDAHPGKLQVIVTGSARLDLYQRGGDSMLGRYELLRLHPFSVGELVGNKALRPPSDFILHEYGQPSSDIWDSLRRFGGFPAPFTSQSVEEYTRWAARRRSQIIREDLRELSAVRSVSMIEQLAILLPERVGNPLSINSLRESLQVAHDTVSSWIEMLERLYFCFRIRPYHKQLSRSIVKEQKLYLWDWAEIDDPANQFENMVASHLLKAIHTWNDLGFGEFDLLYWRGTNKLEVDFVVTNKRKPILAIEAKQNDTNLSPNLRHFSNQIGGKIPMIQLVEKPGVHDIGPDRLVISADRFFASLP